MCLPSWSPTIGAIETGPYQDDWGPGTGDVSRADCTLYDCSSDRAAFAREPGPLGGVLAIVCDPRRPVRCRLSRR